MGLVQMIARGKMGGLRPRLRQTPNEQILNLYQPTKKGHNLCPFLT